MAHFIRSFYWFSVGFLLSGALILGIVLFYFQYKFADRVIPGVFVDNFYIGEKTKEEIESIFKSKNEEIEKNIFIFSAEGKEATISARTLNIGYDVNLIVEQGLSLGKTKNLLSDVYIVLASYINGAVLDYAYTLDDEKLKNELEPIQTSIYREPTNAQFQIVNNRVAVFSESNEGKTINFDNLNSKLRDLIPPLIENGNPKIVRIDIPIETIEPETTTEEANDLGIVEEIGVGRSTFFHSIPNRIHNISLATSRINGVLIAPGEEFSFAKSIGDISKFTGYKEAFVIQGGKTVLGDGGGVCQVSTTLFRAILNSGLPITERHPHAYRVGYYEQDSLPGFDATVYVPSIDLKFKNDMETHILIQGYVDPTNLSLTFTLYGKRDGREISISKPIISSVSAAPAPAYQDDPNLPKGVEKQVDFAAPGGKSVFTRSVSKNGNVIISDTFVSTYQPWQAVFLRGTKE